MTTAVATPERELQRLYERYKSLTLAATAALILARPVRDLCTQAEALHGDCRAAGPVGESTALAACRTAAADLAELLRLAAAGEDTGGLLERVRASHRRLRRAIWDVQPCEYVPCCVTATEEERDG
jgi:hypothetical protein